MRSSLLAGAAVLLLPAAALAQSTTATGTSNAFNPAISVNTLLLAETAAESRDRDFNKIDLQEAEIQMTAAVDPYWKANLVFAVHPEHGHAGEDAHAGYAWDVEVATLDAQRLPWALGLRLGKDYLPFGKQVPLHTHQYAFVRAPIGVRTFLGEHGLTEVGARLSRSVPLPWYADVTGYVVDGRAEGVFDAGSRDPAWGARWVNLWDLSDTATLELSGSYLRGRQAPGYLQPHPEDAAASAGDLEVWGADLTWKWVSADFSHGPAATLTAEVIVPRPADFAGDPLGWYVLGQVRFVRSWWLGATVGGANRDLPAPPAATDDHEHGLFAWEKAREYKANLTWVPSEFSYVRLEVARYDDLAGDADDWLFSAQVNFTIGSHPAHLY